MSSLLTRIPSLSNSFPLSNPASNINPAHRQEWLDSGILEDLINLNLVSLSGNAAYDYLLYSDTLERRNDGRLIDKLMRRYAHLGHGGWGCRTIDPVTGKESLWGCLKPDRPYVKIESKGFGNPPKEKPIKYEHPPGEPTQAFFLKVSLRAWQKISEQCGVPASCPIDGSKDEYGQFWAWVIDNPCIPIEITEGAKKTASLLSAGYVAIGLSGIWNGQIKCEDGRKLKPQLIPFAQDKREVNFCFDNDTKETTKDAVRLATIETGKLLEDKGCDVFVLRWEFPEKGVDDLIVARGSEILNGIFRNRIPLTKLKISKFIDEQWQLWIRSKEFKALVEVNSCYLSDSVDLGTIPSNVFAFFRSGLSTGKTKLLVDYLNQINQGAINIGYRNSLLYQFNENAKFYHISEYGLDEVSFADPSLRISLCIHSILKIPLEAFDGKIIILDELVGILNALLNDKNVKNRVDVIEYFRAAIRRCDKVLCFDGNLSNKEIEYLKSICPEKQLMTVNNSFKGNKALVKIVDGFEFGETIKKNSHGLLLEDLLASGDPIVICSDSQVFVEGLESLIKETEDIKTFRIDSKTIENPEVIAFLANPNQWIVKNKPDVLLYSPTIESGLDITIRGYFKAHYGFFFGVLGCNSIHQMMLRLRDTEADKYLWVKSFVPSETLEKKSSMADLLAEYVRHRFMKEVNFTFGEDLKIESKIQEIYRDCSPEHETELAYKIQSESNFEKLNLRKCVKYVFSNAGHEVETIVYDQINKSLDRNLKQCKKNVKKQNAIDIFTAHDDFIGKAEKRNVSGTHKDQCAIAKAVLVDRLPGILESSTWHENFVYEVTQDNPNLMSQVENYWLLMSDQGNRDLAKEVVKIKYHKILSSPAFLPWLWKPSYLNVKVLRSIGLPKFIKKYSDGGCYHKDNEDVKQIHRLAQSKAQDLKIAVDQEPVRFINKLLKLVGIKTRSAGKQSWGDRLPIHQIDSDWLKGEIFEAIYNGIDKRLTSVLEKNSNLDWVIKNQKQTKMVKQKNGKNSQFETLEPSQNSTFRRQDLFSDGIYNIQDHPDGFSSSEVELYNVVAKTKNKQVIEDAIAVFRSKVKYDDVMLGIYNVGERLPENAIQSYLDVIGTLTA